MIKLTDISKYYKSNDNIAVGLHKINLEFDIGDFVVITGESGGGKSTLLNVISGSLAYDDGELYFEGEETSWYDEAEWENYRKEKIGFVYQDYNLIDSFSALDNVKTAILLLHPEKKEKEAEKKALFYLKKTGLEKQAKKKAAQLSSGQKQRLAIARALAKETSVIVADEPTGNLDVENSRQVVEILSELSKDRLVIMVTHNYEEAQPFATRKIRMYDGEVAEDIRLKPNRYEAGEKNSSEDSKEQVQAPSGKKKLEKLLAKRMIKKVRRAKPYSTAILFVLFLLLYVSIFIFCGSFEKNLDYSPAKEFSDKTFVNNDMTRICVKKSDGSAFTEEDIEKLGAVSYVEYVDLYDMVNDVFCLTEEEKEYAVNPDQSIVVFDENTRLRSVSGMNSKDITSGAMAEGYYEVVVSSRDKSLVGQTITLCFNRKNTWDASLITLDFIVAGITDKGNEGEIYLSESFAKMLNMITSRLTDYQFYGIYAEDGYGVSNKEWLVKTGADKKSTAIEEWMLLSENPQLFEEFSEGKVSKVNMEVLNSPIFLINEELSGSEVRVSKRFFELAYITVTNEKTLLLEDVQKQIYQTAYLFYGPSRKREGTELKIQETETSNSLAVMEVSRELFDTIYPNQDPYQASVYMTDYAYTDRVIKKINEAGYDALSTFRAGGREYDIDKMNQQTFLMFTSLAALISVFFVGIFLIRMMINGRKKDYSIMMLIGVSRSVIDRMNLRDILYHSAAALIGTIIALNLAMYYKIPYIDSAVRYYDMLDYLIFTAIIAAMTVILYRRLKLVKKKLK